MAKQNDVDLQQQGDAIRRFNRFYTRAIGTLHAHFLGSVFTLAEARVIYEISRKERSTATQTWTGAISAASSQALPRNGSLRAKPLRKTPENPFFHLRVAARKSSAQ
jgi:hypothetical protein